MIKCKQKGKQKTPSQMLNDKCTEMSFELRNLILQTNHTAYDGTLACNCGSV